jgi:acyl-coenzyme A thioesterase PaaI-like protein
MRSMQDAHALAAPPKDLVELAAEALAQCTAMLEQWQVSEAERWNGRRGDLPGRGQLFLVPAQIDSTSDRSVRGRVTFTRFYLGAGGAAHGGSLPLLFDELFGHIVNRRHPGMSRTAYLTVHYEQITPIDHELQFEAAIDRIEGRKHFVTGSLTGSDGGILCRAEGLFIVPRS